MNDKFTGSSISEEDAITQLVADVLPRLEQYRAKNVNKYHRENESPDREYTKCERYKNRVRVVDIFLDPIKTFLVNRGVIKQLATEPPENNIE